MMLLYVSAALRSYISVDLPSPHLASPYGCLSEIMKKDQISCCFSHYFSVKHQGFPLLGGWILSILYRWWSHLRTFKTAPAVCRAMAHISHLPGRGRRGRMKKQEFNLLLKPSESCWTVCLLLALFLGEPADPLGAGKTHSDLLLKRQAFWFAFSSRVLIQAK